MPNRLEPVNLIDFTGGLNLRRNQFQLAPNESPEMENITVDPLGGIYTRKGWDRWSPDIVESGSEWDPRRAYLTQLSDGIDVIYVATNNTVYAAGLDAGFSNLGIDAIANSHMADFASFGDDTYIACGRDEGMCRRHRTETVETLTFGGAGSWNDDYLNPAGDVGPKAELVEAHSGYLFAANLSEDGVTFPNRVRWSHPTSPADWATTDFIDIGTGGSEITGLISYEDHLLIFKHDSIWALYGYDLDSWQLVQKSSTIGCGSPQQMTRNETACFFYSQSDRGGIYAYGGERPVEISEQLRYVTEGLVAPDLVWVGWVARKLWVTLPWTYDGPTLENAAVFVFDPSVGQRGAWMYLSSMTSALGPIVGGSNVDTQIRPLGVLRNPEVPCVVRLEAHDRTVDTVWDTAVLGFTDPTAPGEENDEGFIVTGSDSVTGDEIIMSGMPGDEPFRTTYRTPWVTADWPTRKKSFRRPDFVCRVTGTDHALQVRSFRDYEEMNAKRSHTLLVPGGGVSAGEGVGTTSAIWGHFEWGDGTQWGQVGSDPIETGLFKAGASIRRGSSFGLCRSLQLRLQGMTRGARWGVDAIVLKVVMRRFR